MSHVAEVMKRHAASSEIPGDLAALLESAGFTERPDIARFLQPNGSLLVRGMAEYGWSVRNLISYNRNLNVVMGLNNWDYAGCSKWFINVNEMTEYLTKWPNDLQTNGMIVVNPGTWEEDILPGSLVFCKNKTWDAIKDLVHDWRCIKVKGVRGISKETALEQAMTAAHVRYVTKHNGATYLVHGDDIGKFSDAVKAFKGGQETKKEKAKDISWYLDRAMAPYKLKHKEGQWFVATPLPVPIFLFPYGGPTHMKEVRVYIGGKKTELIVARLETDGVVRDVNQAQCDKLKAWIEDTVATFGSFSF